MLKRKMVRAVTWLENAYLHLTKIELKVNGNLGFALWVTHTHSLIYTHYAHVDKYLYKNWLVSIDTPHPVWVCVGAVMCTDSDYCNIKNHLNSTFLNNHEQKGQTNTRRWISWPQELTIFPSWWRRTVWSMWYRMYVALSTWGSHSWCGLHHNNVMNTLSMMS